MWLRIHRPTSRQVLIFATSISVIAVDRQVVNQSVRISIYILRVNYVMSDLKARKWTVFNRDVHIFRQAGTPVIRPPHFMVVDIPLWKAAAVDKQ